MASYQQATAHDPATCTEPVSSNCTRGPTPPTPNTMPYNCQLCVRRKVKCDRKAPTCSSCVKFKQDCVYQAPSKPRRKKRKGNETEDHAAEEDVHERLARYERILRENGLLEAPEHEPSGDVAEKKELQSPTSHEPLRSAKLLSGGGKSRYIHSQLWLETSEEDIHDLSDDGEGQQNVDPSGSSFMHTYDPASGALLGLSQNLVAFHPSHEHAMKLWHTHVHNVEPLCRVLHIPTTAKMVTAVSQQPSTATRAQECQLFAIYHFAVYSLTDEDCLRDFGESQAVLRARYEHALRQALVNASWLKTTEMPVMQAYMLYLIAGRSFLDPHTYWILTGVGVRIAQRMGLHRDGESLGLPPFEVQMRRRLFWQLVPLDVFAGQHSGTGISMRADAWDVKKPLNVDDDQIYPGMTQQPEESQGATDMMFALVRMELSTFFVRTALAWENVDQGPSVHHKPTGRSAKLIDEVEAAIEEKFLRYCDILDPLHYLVLIVARSAANVVRLRQRMTPMKHHATSDAERRSVCALALRILDSDSAIYSQPGLRPWRWQVREFFLWDALICVLTCLARPGFFAPAELDATWAKMGDMFANHPEIIETRRPVHVSAWKAFDEAWAANPPSDADPEPAFITRLRRGRGGRSAGKPAGGAHPAVSGPAATAPVPSLGSGFADWDETSLDVVGGYSPGVADWVFWDQFLQNAGSGPGWSDS